MDAHKTVKPKRHRKKKSRTEVSSDSESEVERKEVTLESAPAKKTISRPKTATDSEVSAAFTKFYMQRATMEFAEDLDKIREADDFKDDALPLLINALQQGTSVFSIQEQRRIVTAAKEKDEKLAAK